MKNLILGFLFAFLISCENNSSTLTQTEDGNYQVQIDPSKISMVNMSDAMGKQGRWQEVDTIAHRITKEMFYKNNLLDGTFLEYKSESSDTLILGNYLSGKKQGEWKYWSTNSNIIERIEIFENDILKETKKP